MLQSNGTADTPQMTPLFWQSYQLLARRTVYFIMAEQQTLGSMIRHERTRRGWRRGALAESIGCSDDSIERWERDEVQPKRWADKRAIAAFLDKPLEELFPPAVALSKRPTTKTPELRRERVRDLRLSDPRFKQGAEPIQKYFEG